MYRLIAFDLDGTFLDDEKQIPEENLRAIERAAGRGVEIVPATGRIYRGIPEELKALPFIRYYILSNGAAVYDAREDRLLYRGDIPLELALRCYAYLDSLPVIYDCYQNEMGYMSRAMYERAEEYLAGEPGILKLVHQLRVPVEDLKETLRRRGEPLQKLQMYFRPEDLDERERQLKQIPALFPALKATSSVSCNIEVNSVEAGKGKALAALCRALGLSLEETVAFGDGTNDLEMLRCAGLGVAMENASDEVKAGADLVTARNTDCGVARCLEALFKE